ncbi:aldehyde dehydrogenase [Xylaria longipes]|nr:aldehyde dehydrogenase [Xylaria longipes]
MSVETITTISPTTNEPILTRNGVSASELEEIPRIATEAFKTWRATSLTDRTIIVKKALELLEKQKDQLAEELTVQMGRPIAYTGVEITTAIKRANYLIKISEETLKDTEGEAEKGFKRFIRKVPVGPVLVIFAWNIFAEAGLPAGVIQYFHCGSPFIMESVVRDPKVSLICFTGSVAGGLAVQKAASDRIVNVGLELGGKDPAYVREDVDLDWAAAEIVDGSIFNSGQSCCAIERVYVHEKIYSSFIKATQKVLEGYKVGDPLEKDTQIGPVISKRSKETIEAQIKEALEKGAKDATPETLSSSTLPSRGNFVIPTLLVDVNHSMRIMTEETFGPVVCVKMVKDDDEAIQEMNDSEFGLTASIWTKDTDKGYELAQRVEAGTVFVNRADFPSPDLAWTGWKNSGKGVTLSRYGFDQFVKLKSFHLKDYPK